MLQLDSTLPRMLVTLGLTSSLFSGFASAQHLLGDDIAPCIGMDDAAITPDGRYGIVRQNAGATIARIYDMATGGIIRQETSGIPISGGVAEDAVVASNSRAVVMGTSLMIFDLTLLPAQPMITDEFIGWRPRDLGLTPDGSLLAVRGGSGDNGGLFVYEMQTGTQVLQAAGQPSDYPAGSQHSFDVDSVAVDDEHAVFTSVIYGGPTPRTRVTIVDLHPQGGGAPQVVYETAATFSTDQVGAPHDIAITPDGLFCAVRSELEVACYSLNGAGSARAWAARLAGNPGGFGDSALDSIEVTNDRIATISRQSNPAYALGAQLDVFDMAGNQVFDRVSGDPHDLAIDESGTRLVVRTHSALYIYDLTSWPAGANITALDSVSPATSTSTSWGAGMDSVAINGERVVSLFRVGENTEVFTHDFAGNQLRLVGQHTMTDKPIDLAITPTRGMCAISGLVSVDVIDLNTGEALFTHRTQELGSWPWCDGVVVDDEHVLAFGVGTHADSGTVNNGWVSIVDLFSSQVNYCTSSPNSFSNGAHIYAGGTASVSANDLSLWCEGAPTSRMGWFAYGDQTANAPFGSGTLCVAGSTARFRPLFIGNGGLAGMEVDYSSLPPTGGLISPGSTWRFQFLFRDTFGGSMTFNSSEGLELLFTN